MNPLTAKNNGLGRPPHQRVKITEAIRERILTGEILPGRRLPSLRTMAREFETSLVTAQQAITELATDGFVEAHGARGTFVSAHPPHRSQFGLLFPRSRERLPLENRLWLALLNEADRSLNDPAHRVVPYFEIDGHVDSPGYRRLLRDIRRRCLAGLFFTFPPDGLLRSPILRGGGLARVGIMPDAGRFTGISPLTFDFDSFVHHVFSALEREGRRRVALLTVPGMEGLWQATLDARPGLERAPHWLQSVAPAFPESACNLVRLLFASNPGQRPDALIITDDNLVPAATAGIVASGVRVPEDLQVVAHCNFPWPTPSAVPATRVGYDAAEVLRRCLEEADAQRDGRATRRIPIQARCERRP